MVYKAHTSITNMNIEQLVKYIRKNVRVQYMGRRFKKKLFMKHLKEAHTKIKIKTLHTDTTFHKYFDLTFVPAYKHSWATPGDLNIRFVDYVGIHKWRRLKKKKKQVIITVVYHPVVGQRVIIDGVHRAMAIARHGMSSKITIYEIRTPMAHVFFPCDFGNIMLEKF